MDSNRRMLKAQWVGVAIGAFTAVVTTISVVIAVAPFVFPNQWSPPTVEEEPTPSPVIAELNPVVAELEQAAAEQEAG